MRAICRLPGERTFNTRGAPGSPRVFTSAANTAAVTLGMLRIIVGIIQCVSRVRDEEPRVLRGGGIAEYALAYVRVAISRRCARAHGVNRATSTIFQEPELLHRPVCYHARGIVHNRNYAPGISSRLQRCIRNISAIRGTCIHERTLVRELRFDYHE